MLVDERDQREIDKRVDEEAEEEEDTGPREVNLSQQVPLSVEIPCLCSADLTHRCFYEWWTTSRARKLRSSSCLWSVTEVILINRLPAVRHPSAS